jgi:guanylate kinase
VVDTVMDALINNTGGNFYLDAPGGTGKTTVMNCILDTARQKGPS